jgi:hypothetical protein
MSETILLIFVALVGLGIGVAVGLLVASMRPQKAGEPQASPKSRPNMTEVATIWQDRKSGQPYPEVNGKIVRFPADLTAGQRDRLAGTLALLVGWLRPAGGAAEGAVPKAAIDAPAAAPGEPYSQPASSGTPGLMNPVDVVARAIQVDARPSADKDASIVMQINDILQEKLAASDMANKGVFLMELPSKDLVVMVGLTQYPGIDAVPDPEIRKLIRESVAEWESRSTIGGQGQATG